MGKTPKKNNQRSRFSRKQDPHLAREEKKYDNPIPSREFILEALEAAPGPMRVDDVLQVFGIEAPEQQEAMTRRLGAMARDGQVVSTRRGEFAPVDKLDLVRGRIQAYRDGFGFVIPADGGDDVYLTPRQMRKVFDGDEVLVSPDIGNFKGRSEGKIVQVLARNTQQLVGRYTEQGGFHFVSPDNPRLLHDVIVPADTLENSPSAKPGQFVVVEITEQPARYKRPEGRIVEVLGDHMAPGMEIDVAIRSHDIPHTWPSEVTQEVQGFSENVAEADKKGRVDLRKLPLVTIDGEDARDFDDAVYCERKPRGGFRLIVAIADVSHYVATSSALDQEAVRRGNSVYFPDFVVPMLPEVLSNGLCSLNPKVDRLCMVCDMTVSAAGKISRYKFYEGVMHSKARLTYTEVGAFLEKKSSSKKTKVHNVKPVIEDLYSLYQRLREARESRGAIDFETHETRIIFDENRKIEKIVPVVRNDAHRLIEECMLAANVCAAKFLASLEIPTLYRVHEGPRDEKLQMLQEFLRGLGLGLKTRGKIGPQDYRDVLEAAKGRADAHLIQTVMLRSMNQARYQTDNHGHFGLAFPAYTHFTSPIRRYPDLLVHRAIRAAIRARRGGAKIMATDQTPLGDFAVGYPYSEIQVRQLGEQSSTTERRADDATRDVVSWLKCEYLSERVGERFTGVISSVTSFGLFVELDSLYVEGLIHISTLPQDYYHFEASQHRLVGERTHRVFRIGDRLSVQVARVDLDERKIDFELIKSLNNKSEKSQPNRKIRKRAIKNTEEPVGSASPASEDKSKPAKSTAAKKSKDKRVSKSKSEKNKKASTTKKPKKPESKAKKSKKKTVKSKKKISEPSKKSKSKVKAKAKPSKPKKKIR